MNIHRQYMYRFTVEKYELHKQYMYRFKGESMNIPRQYMYRFRGESMNIQRQYVYRFTVGKYGYTQTVYVWIYSGKVRIQGICTDIQWESMNYTDSICTHLQWESKNIHRHYMHRFTVGK